MVSNDSKSSVSKHMDCVILIDTSGSPYGRVIRRSNNYVIAVPCPTTVRLEGSRALFAMKITTWLPYPIAIRVDMTRVNRSLLPEYDKAVPAYALHGDACIWTSFQP